MNAQRSARHLVISAATSLAVAAPVVALAQQPDPNVAVTDRARPEYDPLGIRAGGFLVYPSLTLSETYDDNVFATPNDEQDDFITIVQPRVQVESNFPRHELGLLVGSDVAFFVSEQDENFQDVFAEADGRLDITRRSTLDAGLEIGRFHEERDDPEAIDAADEITQFYRYGGALAYRHVFNRLNFQLSGSAVLEDFEDVDDINNDDRDRVDYDILFRTGYLISPRFNVFAEGRYTIEDFLDNEDDAGFDRDSDGWEARLGTEVDITAVLFGEAFVGYREEYFEDPAFDSVNGISFGIDLTWNPTQLTTLVLSGGSDVEATNQGQASSNFATEIALSVDHELLRNVLIGATVAYGRDDFEEVERVDNTIDAEARVTYLLNRNFALQGAYLFTDRWSDLADEEFTRNRVTLSLTAQL